MTPNTIRIGLVGMGYRGSYLYKLLRSMTDMATLVAVADPNITTAELDSSVRLYNDGLDSYRSMLTSESLDLVVIASPWQYHVRQAHYALSCGCHVALEIKPALSDNATDEYAPLKTLAEERGLQVLPLENTIFIREIMSVLCMVRAGILGELVHLRGGYRHDLRKILLDSNGRPTTTGEGAWRFPYYMGKNADIYPTHGFAPIALMAGIGRTDEMCRIYSQGSKARGMSERVEPELRHNNFISDVITTHVTTRSGTLLNLIHDTTLPRPRSLDWEVQGLRGVWDGVSRRIYIEGRSPQETWEDDEPYIREYLHPYWERWGEIGLEVDRHHKGMDYVMLRAMLESVRGDEAFPINIEDFILWSSITTLSARSLAKSRALDLNAE